MKLFTIRTLGYRHESILAGTKKLALSKYVKNIFRKDGSIDICGVKQYNASRAIQEIIAGRYWYADEEKFYRPTKKGE